MFDAIAPHYDLLNTVLSAGRDRAWRARAVASLRLRGDEVLLDVCAGTADVMIAALTARPAAAASIGVDFAADMLRRGRQKLVRARLARRTQLLRGDATRLPVQAATVDVATVAFGIRNVEEPAAACAELYRALRPGGRLAILEFGLPSFPGLRRLYEWYFTTVLPRLGRLVSRHGDAYSYLPASVGAFPPPADFCDLLRRAGFVDVGVVPLTFGIVLLFTASKPVAPR